MNTTEDITTVKDIGRNTFEVTCGNKTLFVPDDMDNRHRVIIQEWLEIEGNELTEE